MTDAIIRESIIREREGPSGIAYRVHLERPLTDEEIRSYEQLVSDEQIEEVPDKMPVNFTVTHQSGVEAEDWVRERMPNSWSFIDSKPMTHGYRELP